MVGKDEKQNRGLATYGRILISINMCNRSSKRRREETKEKMGQKNFEKIITKKFSNMVKNTNLLI